MEHRNKCGVRITTGRARSKRVSRDNSILTYKEDGTGGNGLYITDYTLSPEQSYFEIEILDQGELGAITMGLVPEGYKLPHQPGWREYSVGYHADDGKLYKESSTGTPFGDKCHTGDVMGCGIKFNQMKYGDSAQKTLPVFFTKNGKEVGTVVCELPTNGWFPAIGLNSVGEMVRLHEDSDWMINKVKKAIDDLKAQTGMDTHAVVKLVQENLLQVSLDAQYCLMRFGDYLADIGGAMELTKLVKRMRTMNAEFGMDIVIATCLNYSHASFNLCKEFGESGLLEIIINDVSHCITEKQGQIDVKKLGILHNCAKAAVNRHVYHKHHVIERISPLLQSDDREVATMTLLTLSYIIESDKIHYIEPKESYIAYILEILKRAIDDPRLLGKSDDGGYSASEIVVGLGNIAACDQNKVTIVDQGAVPLLVDMLKLDEPVVVEGAMNTLWVISQLEKNKKRMVKVKELKSSLLQYSKYANVELKQAADRVLLSLYPSGISTRVSGGRCEYQQKCERFKKSLKLNECYFDNSFDMCYCTSCHAERGDQLYYTRGQPMRDYAMPIGWCRFALKVEPRANDLQVFEKWHVAFHGTPIRYVESILKHGDLLMPGDKLMGGEILGEREGHFNDKRKPKGFDTKQLFLSPTIRYSGRDVYAKPSNFTDSGKSYKAKIAFQVCIRPDSYKTGRQTIGAKERIDTKFSNEEIEWFTKERRCVVLYGLVIRLY
ncbi:uncharacterized protein LOC144348043 [Saccoglossus kowalevskii]